MKQIANIYKAAWLIATFVLLSAAPANGIILWSDVGATLAHETGQGKDILGGTIRRDGSSTGVLYFKFHVDPLSDFHTEQYLAGFQLFEGSQERLGVGNAWDAISYSAFQTAQAENLIRIPREFDLRSAQGSSRERDGHAWMEFPVRDTERTIVFKVEYIPGSNDLITVWLNPDLGPGATESGQKLNLTTHFTADASFNEIHLRHVGGGDGWIFSDMAISTSFNDFVASSPDQSASISEREKGGPPFEFQTWHREQGLLRESVYALTQSPQGYLWVGTDDGVARFDGVHFVSYGLQEGLPVGAVRALLADHDGTLWIGTSGNGLARVRDGKIIILTKRDGLPGDVITSLAEDKQGRLWVGTDGGLAVCQDGRVSLLPDEFKNKSITALFEDRLGTLWIGVKGIGVYQHSDEKFTLLESKLGQGLLKDSHCLLMDREGQLWVGAGDDCILCYDGREWIQHRISRHFTHPYVATLAEGSDDTIWAGSMGEGLMNFRETGSQIVNARSGLSDDFVESLLCDAQGNLWVGTQYGLNELKRGQLFALTAKEGLGYGAVEGMAEVSPGTIIIGKAEDGLRLWDGTNVNFIPHNFFEGNPQVRAMLVAHDGSFWCAGAQGLWYFNNAGILAGRSVNLQTARPSPVFPTINDAYNLMAFSQDGVPFSPSASVDPQGHLYSANQLGPSVDWDGSTFKFGPVGSLNAVSSTPFSLPAGRYSMLKLLATGVNGKHESQVFTVNYTDGTTSNYTQSLSDWKTPQEGYAGESVAITMPYRNVSDGTRQTNDYHLYGYCFILNSNKTVSSLVPPSDGNVIILAVALSPEVQSELVNTGLTDSSLIQLPKLIVNTLCEDSKNRIWAGTQEGELWQERDGKWTMQTNFACPITSMLAGNDGALWIGTEGAGLFQFKNQNCTPYCKTNGLLSQSIRALHFDEQETLWIGTMGGGLSRLRDGNIATFAAREGLPDNTISQILEDDIGRLWLGTDHGIIAVGRDDLEQCAIGKAASVYPQVYGKENGMPSEKCTGGFFPAGLKTSSGLLCFSTQRGLVVVDPHSRNNLIAPAPSVIIEQLAVDGVAQPWESQSDGSSSLLNSVTGQKASDAKTPLRLAPGNHRIEVHYTGLNFKEPGRIHFRYQLEGLDPGWIYVGVQRIANYDLVPGKYQFRLQAYGEDGVWKESDNALAFVVPQLFWKSWWFVNASIVILLIAVGTFGRSVERRRHWRRLEELERERAMERERMRIAHDLHDEIGAKLCRISYLSKDAARENGEPEKLRSQITAISETARNVLQALDEIVWTVNPQNDTLENLAGYIEQMGPEYFETTGIECEVEVPVSLPSRPISSQVRHHLFSAVHEAWANTLKHSKATRATVNIKCSAEDFEIIVSDNGIGFDVPKADALPDNNEFGNGLRNMRQRMREVGGECVIQSKPGHGASLRFTIPLNLDDRSSENV